MFYEQDERRRGSHVLSYGTGWRDQAWTTLAGHVVELMWFGATHELTALYIAYDWDRLPHGQLARDSVLATAEADGLDAGNALGRALADADLAVSDTFIKVLTTLPSALECHRLLWDWRWLQHHPDGLAQVQRRIVER